MVIKLTLDEAVVGLLDTLASDDDRTRSQMVARLVKERAAINTSPVKPIKAAEDAGAVVSLDRVFAMLDGDK